MQAIVASVGFIHLCRRLTMPKSAPQKKLVLNRDTVRLLVGTNGAGLVAITTRGPTEVETYCDCGPAPSTPDWGC